MSHEPTDPATADLCGRHLRAMVAANEDPDIRKPVADPCATPLLNFAGEFGPASPLANPAGDVGFRHQAVSFFVRTRSQEVWGAVTALEALFSDGRGIEPRFAFAQLCGEERVAAGNEYRLAISEDARLAPVNAAMADFAREGGIATPLPALTVRRMDVRLVRAGPFGGETADLVAVTLANHRLAGLSSAWVVVHAESGDTLRVVLDTAELFRWTWAPDRLADRTPALAEAAARILDWPQYMARLLAVLDGEPMPPAEPPLFRVGPWHAMSGDPQLREAMAAHPSLRDLAARLDAAP